MDVHKLIDLGHRGRCVEVAQALGQNDQAKGADGPQAHLTGSTPGGFVVDGNESDALLACQDNGFHLPPMQGADRAANERMPDLGSFPAFDEAGQSQPGLDHHRRWCKNLQEAAKNDRKQLNLR